MNNLLINKLVPFAKARPRPVGWISCLALLALFVGCSKSPQPSDEEKGLLATLKAEYELRGYKLDASGRVINLDLEGSQVDDGALSHVVQFKMLRSISLANSSITDSGLVKLNELKRLQLLDITATKVTDRGLGFLQDIPSLRVLKVVQTNRLTAQGIDYLKEAIPGIMIVVVKE